MEILKEITDSLHEGKLTGTTLEFEDAWSDQGHPTRHEIDLRWLQIAGTELVAVNGVLMLPDADLIRAHILTVTGCED